MEMKLYASFLSTLRHDRRDAIEEILAEVSFDLNSQEELLKGQCILRDQMQQYEQYFQKVMNGEIGFTAQYWAMYVYMINRMHRDLMRVMRTNNIEDYISALPAVIDIFFAFNRKKLCTLGCVISESESAASQAKMVLRAESFSVR